jgi:regulator-associated protein of mTOR
LLTLFSGTSAHIVKVFNFDGQELSRMEPYSSFLQQSRGSTISTTAFHPHRMILGCAARGDHHINLFTCAQEKPDAYLNSI